MTTAAFYSDPLHFAGARYFDGTAWTDQVYNRDGDFGSAPVPSERMFPPQRPPVSFSWASGLSPLLFVGFHPRVIPALNPASAVGGGSLHLDFGADGIGGVVKPNEGPERFLPLWAAHWDQVQLWVCEPGDWLRRHGPALEYEFRKDYLQEWYETHPVVTVVHPAWEILCLGLITSKVDKVLRKLEKKSKSNARVQRGQPPDFTPDPSSPLVQAYREILAPPEPEPSTSESRPTKPSVYEEVRELAALRDEGLLTDDEFETRKRDLLGL